MHEEDNLYTILFYIAYHICDAKVKKTMVYTIFQFKVKCVCVYIFGLSCYLGNLTAKTSAIGLRCFGKSKIRPSLFPDMFFFPMAASGQRNGGGQCQSPNTQCSNKKTNQKTWEEGKRENVNTPKLFLFL